MFGLACHNYTKFPNGFKTSEKKIHTHTHIISIVLFIAFGRRSISRTRHHMRLLLLCMTLWSRMQRTGNINTMLCRSVLSRYFYIGVAMGTRAQASEPKRIIGKMSTPERLVAARV